MANKIRLWKLGSIEHNIFPSEAAFEKFCNALRAAKESEDDIADIIWTDGITVEELDVEDFDDFVFPYKKI